MRICVFLAIYIEHNDSYTEVKEPFGRGGVHTSVVKEQRILKVIRRQVTILSRLGSNNYRGAVLTFYSYVNRQNTDYFVTHI
jgi:hypothetical protein